MLLEAGHGGRVCQEHAGIENVRASIALAGADRLLGSGATLFVDHRYVSDPCGGRPASRLFGRSSLQPGGAVLVDANLGALLGATVYETNHNDLSSDERGQEGFRGSLRPVLTLVQEAQPRLGENVGNVGLGGVLSDAFSGRIGIGSFLLRCDGDHAADPGDGAAEVSGGEVDQALGGDLPGATGRSTSPGGGILRALWPMRIRVWARR
ncbi:hypothetical protein ABZ070_30080 [Streptomyces sp. NPDC006283]|uniref:hypothetical protein n=1 Tax=Streptomyces sp. NPDC006283 TaxID=3156741 RepID=UPI0033A7977C